jgi:ribosomal protein S27E
MIRLRCEHCRKGLNITEGHAGQRARCPFCQGTIRVPPAGGTSATEEKHLEGLPPVSRPSAPEDQSLELLREPSRPDGHESQRIAFWCETQGPAQAPSPPAPHREQEPAAVPPAGLLQVLLYPMNLDGVARTVILALALWALHELIVVVYPWSTYTVSRVALLLGGLYCILVGRLRCTVFQLLRL